MDVSARRRDPGALKAEVWRKLLVEEKPEETAGRTVL
jgi:hypothetical protein